MLFRSRGISGESGKKGSGQVRELKKKIKDLKSKREKSLAEGDQRMADIYRKKIIRLKKKTRRAA